MIFCHNRIIILLTTPEGHIQFHPVKSYGLWGVHPEDPCVCVVTIIFALLA